MKHISIVLNGVKGQFDNMISVIHASRKPYDLASVSSVLLDAESRQTDLLLDANLTANVFVNHKFSMKNNASGSNDSFSSPIIVSSN